jgi:hypothetical protein
LPGSRASRAIQIQGLFPQTEFRNFFCSWFSAKDFAESLLGVSIEYFVITPHKCSPAEIVVLKNQMPRHKKPSARFQHLKSTNLRTVAAPLYGSLPHPPDQASQVFSPFEHKVHEHIQQAEQLIRTSKENVRTARELRQEAKNTKARTRTLQIQTLKFDSHPRTTSRARLLAFSRAGELPNSACSEIYPARSNNMA